MINPDSINLERETYVVEEGTVLVVSIQYGKERIERYFLLQRHDFEGIEINQISTEMAFRLVRRK